MSTFLSTPLPLQMPERIRFTHAVALLSRKPWAQEVYNTRVAIRPERRRAAEAELCAMFGQAVQTIEAALTHSADAVLTDAIAAFAQWLQGAAGRGVDVATLPQQALVWRVLQELAGTQRFEAAADAVDELIFCAVVTDADGFSEPRPGSEPLMVVRGNSISVEGSGAERERTQAMHAPAACQVADAQARSRWLAVAISCAGTLGWCRDHVVLRRVWGSFDDRFGMLWDHLRCMRCD